jgi:hypothetical protein
MYDSWIDIPFKENSSLEHVVSMWSAVLIWMRRVIDTSHHWSAVSLTLPTSGKQCH